MLQADEYRFKVVDGRKHIADATFHNAKAEHERCQASLQKKRDGLTDPSNPQAIPQYNTMLKRCLLSEEEMLAAEVVANHYAARLSDLHTDRVDREMARLDSVSR